MHGIITLCAYPLSQSYPLVIFHLELFFSFLCFFKENERILIRKRKNDMYSAAAHSKEKKRRNSKTIAPNLFWKGENSLRDWIGFHAHAQSMQQQVALVLVGALIHHHLSFFQLEALSCTIPISKFLYFHVSKVHKTLTLTLTLIYI